MSSEVDWTETEKKALTLRRTLVGYQRPVNYTWAGTSQEPRYIDWAPPATSGVTAPRYAPYEQELLSKLENRIRHLETMLEQQMATFKPSSDAAVQLQNDIVEKVKPALEGLPAGSAVAITYDGKVIAKADTDMELLSALDKLAYPAGQIFLHRVGAKGIGGWA